jgi:hypothetical protein
MSDPNQPQWGQQPPEDPYQRQYGPPPSAPPYAYGPYAQPATGTNRLAIIAFVLAFFCSLAGLVCGIIALNQISQRRQGGRGLAIAAIVISALSMIIGIALFAGRR